MGKRLGFRAWAFAQTILIFLTIDIGDEMEISNEELVTVRDGMRELNKFVDRLISGEREKYVLMRHGKMVAIVISVDRYEEVNLDATTNPALTSE